MEYMPGGDLYQLLSSIVIPQQTIRFIIAEVILALLYLHSKDIIHKDIKPENVLLSKDGHFKLTDFGLSESDSNSNTYAILHRDDGFDLLADDAEIREIVGTLNYMAPETFTDDHPSFDVDYWALGVLIYELFTFKAPFTGETPHETKENIIREKINWSYFESDETKETYTNIKEAKDLILKFLVKDRNKRWGDKDFALIKAHPFFKGFYWEAIDEIRDKTILMHVKKQIDKTNAQIKASKKKQNENSDSNSPLLISQNNDDESLSNTDFYCERVDNLFSKCQDLIKGKIRQKELTMNENDIDNDHENYISLFEDLK